MPDPKRTASQSRFATTVIEARDAPPHREVPVAPPVPRKETPVGMPAPPAQQPTDRESHDDIDHVIEVERLERERAGLLVELQDARDETKRAKLEARQLREPTAVFPPVSIPPPAKAPPIESAPPDLKALEKALMKSRLGKAAYAVGILLALGWNAFNSVRAPSPEKVAAVQERVTQSDKARDEKLLQDALEKQRTLAAFRALRCWGKQLRGASARQGLDLPSLPPGGVTAQRLDQGDPSKPPAFVATEICPPFPKLPPEAAANEP